MRSASLSVVLLLSLLSAHSFAGEARNVTYTGTISGTLRIHMKLSIQDEAITGSYSYDKNKVNIALKGKMPGEGSFEIQEYDPHGAVTGVFRGEMESLLELAGQWSKPDGSKKVPFELKADPVYDNGKSAGWAGNWTYVESSRFDLGTLEIANEAASGFDFHLYAQSGGHEGEVEGSARISGSTASWTDADTGCNVTASLKDQVLTVKTTDPCQQFCGMGVGFPNGAYRQGISPAEKSLVDLAVLEDTAQEKAFQQLTGPDYSLFLNSFQLITLDKDLDHLGATVLSGGVRGLFTIQEAIILYRGDGKFWAAAIDPEQDVVKYFTNDPAYAKQLPKTIEAWRKDFAGKKVLFMNPNAK